MSNLDDAVRVELLIEETIVYPHKTELSYYVSPVSDVTYSLMVSGCPWPGRENKNSLIFNELSKEAKEEILRFFRNKYPNI